MGLVWLSLSYTAVVENIEFCGECWHYWWSFPTNFVWKDLVFCPSPICRKNVSVLHAVIDGNPVYRREQKHVNSHERETFSASKRVWFPHGCYPHWKWQSRLYHWGISLKENHNNLTLCYRTHVAEFSNNALFLFFIRCSSTKELAFIFVLK